MAAGNKTLGKFHLIGIPPAPRGVPQIEVTFDIDANGIVHVSAKDLGTGKEQKIKIESSSGISEDEIDRMVKDAESHAAEDKERRETIDVRNQADTLVYQTEKTLGEHGDKVPESEKQAIQDAVAELKKVKDSGTADEIKAKMEALTQASHKLAEAMYKEAQSQQQAAQQAAPGQETTGAQEQGATGGDEDVVDADFEEVK